jgi:hypothetical protein
LLKENMNIWAVEAGIELEWVIIHILLINLMSAISHKLTLTTDFRRST